MTFYVKNQAFLIRLFFAYIKGVYPFKSGIWYICRETKKNHF
jgi:hypothetical protein